MKSNSSEKILIIEDEEALGEGLVFNFEAEGFEVEWIKNGREGLERLQKSNLELETVILDLMLPECDGFEILAKTRVLAPQIPILILSAKGLESDKVKALQLGADDYVTKPFSLTELILRVKNLTKKRKWYKASLNQVKIQIGKAVYHPDSLILNSSDGQSHRISPTEGLLIQVLLENENKILTRGELLQKVWQYESSMETRTVDVFVSKLRKFIEPQPNTPFYLHSVRGVGYVYVTDEKFRKEISQK